jgi:hypothetical protein
MAAVTSGPLAEFGWMATKGTAWLFRRSRDLVPALAALAPREGAPTKTARNLTSPPKASQPEC